MRKLLLCATLLILPQIMMFPRGRSFYADAQPGSWTAAQVTPTAQETPNIPADARYSVASIREYDPQGRTVYPRNGSLANSGEFNVEGWTFRMLVEKAYGIQQARVLGGPNWIDSLRFEIKATSDDSLKEELRKFKPWEAVPFQQRMLQALLEDRFQLKTHRDSKKLPCLALLVAKSGSRLGDPVDKCGPPPGSVRSSSGFWIPKAPPHQPDETLSFACFMTVSDIADMVSRDVGRPVVDKTGLPGHYQFTLHWAPSPTGAGDSGSGNPKVGAGQPGSVLPDSGSGGPSIFVALQEQLGLRLVARKVTVEVLVIDQAEHPSEN